jgi:transcriptional regulator with XRE-family HTH domain
MEMAFVVIDTQEVKNLIKKNYGGTQEEFAQVIGLSSGQLENVLAGRANMGPEPAMRTAIELNRPMHSLFRLEGRTGA